MTLTRKQLQQITLALWQAWYELNTIRARDGVPYTHTGYISDVSEAYFSQVVDDLDAAIELLTGEAPKPWPPSRVLGMVRSL